MSSIVTQSVIRIAPAIDRGASLSSLRPGQAVNAEVVRAIAPGGQGVIRIGAQLLTASSTLGLAAGERLQLEVMRLTPTLELKLATQPTPANDPARAQSQLLRDTLPRQMSLGDALARATQAMPRLEPLLAVSDGTAKALAKALDGVAMARVVPERLSDPHALRHAIKHSGTFFEAMLATSLGGDASHQVGADLKAQLLLFRDALLAAASRPVAHHSAPTSTSFATTQSPPSQAGGAAPKSPAAPSDESARSSVPVRAASFEASANDPAVRRDGPPMNSAAGVRGAQSDAEQALTQTRQMVDGALARIEMNQALSTRSAHEPSVPIVVEIPLQSDGDESRDIRLVIEREDHHEGAQARRVWKVELDVEPPELGRIVARLSLEGEKLSVRLGAEQATTREQLRNDAQHLADAFTGQGLELARVHVDATPPARSVVGAFRVTANLLSVQA